LNSPGRLRASFLVRMMTETGRDEGIALVSNGNSQPSGFAEE